MNALQALQPGTTLRIGNRPFRLEALHDDGKEDNCAMTLPEKGLIKVNFDLLDVHRAETILHEVLHVICLDHKWFDLNRDEKFVHPMARAIYQVLADNGLLAEVAEGTHTV